MFRFVARQRFATGSYYRRQLGKARNDGCARDLVPIRTHTHDAILNRAPIAARLYGRGNRGVLSSVSASACRNGKPSSVEHRPGSGVVAASQTL